MHAIKEHIECLCLKTFHQRYVIIDSTDKANSDLLAIYFAKNSTLLPVPRVVAVVLSVLNLQKSPGPYVMLAMVLQLFLLSPFKNYFVLSFTTSVFRVRSCLDLLPPRNSSSLSSYRSITLAPILSKILKNIYKGYRR